MKVVNETGLRRVKENLDSKFSNVNTELARKANTSELKEKIETKDLYINNVKVIWSD